MLYMTYCLRGRKVKFHMEGIDKCVNICYNRIVKNV